MSEDYTESLAGFAAATGEQLGDLLREKGYVLYRRRCSNPTIRTVSDNGAVKEVRCGCGYSGFNLVGMEAEYERHRKQSESDA